MKPQTVIKWEHVVSGEEDTSRTGYLFRINCSVKGKCARIRTMQRVLGWGQVCPASAPFGVCTWMDSTKSHFQVCILVFVWPWRLATQRAPWDRRSRPAHVIDEWDSHWGIIGLHLKGFIMMLGVIELQFDDFFSCEHSKCQFDLLTELALRTSVKENRPWEPV